MKPTFPFIRVQRQYNESCSFSGSDGIMNANGTGFRKTASMNSNKRMGIWILAIKFSAELEKCGEVYFFPLEPHPYNRWPAH